MIEIKVSVVIPVYNMQKYLRDCLNSVVNQTLQEIEIIVINDGSIDNSLAICNEYAALDDRVIIHNKKNEGVATARNDGIKIARGKYIAFLDSDDMFSNANVLEKLYYLAINNSVSVAGGLRERLFQDGHIEKDTNTILIDGVEFKANELTEYKDYQYDYGYTCYIFSRQMIIDNKIFFPDYSRFQDPPFFVQAMFAAKQFYMLNEHVYRYRYIDEDEKYTLKKTMDQLQGVIDNLVFSKKHNLPRLHYVSAIRLNTECGYMVSRNLDSPEKYTMIRKLIDANSLVDEQWLKENGIMIKPFVLDFFKYSVETSLKYEKLRNKKIVKLLRKMI